MTEDEIKLNNSKNEAPQTPEASSSPQQNSWINAGSWLSNARRITHASFLQTIIGYWSWVVGICILSLAFDELTTDLQHYFQQHSRVPVISSLFLVLLSLAWSIASNIIILIIACLGVERFLGELTPSPLRMLTKHLEQLMIESVRALGVSLCWLQALILPGIFKYLRYSFVPFVVLFDRAYERGEVDALKRSNEIIRGHTWPIFCFFGGLFLYLIVLAGLSSTLTSTFTQNPIGSVVSELFSTLGFLYFSIFLYAVYKNLASTNKECMQR